MRLPKAVVVLITTCGPEGAGKEGERQSAKPQHEDRSFSQGRVTVFQGKLFQKLRGDKGTFWGFFPVCWVKGVGCQSL